MLKFLFLAVVSASLIFVVDGTAHASTECYGMAGSSHETQLSTQSKVGQQFVMGSPAKLVSVSMNIYADVGSTAFFHFQIHETTLGIPNATIVPGSIVQTLASTVPDGAVGIGQRFICGAVPHIQKFTFATPITLTSGDMYAFAVYATTGAGGARTVGWVQGIPSLVPEEGLYCTGAPCTTHVGWALTSSGGDNYDMVYSVETDVIDTDPDDGKIDGHINNFRNYLRLDGVNGGLLFTVGIISLVFIVGIKSGVPFLILAMINAVVAGVFARKDILPAWVLIAAVTLGGMAIIFTILGSRRDES